MIEFIERILIRLLTNIVNASNHTKCISLSNPKGMINLLLLIDILMNKLKDYVTIHLQLILIDVS